MMGKVTLVANRIYIQLDRNIAVYAFIKYWATVLVLMSVAHYHAPVAGSANPLPKFTKYSGYFAATYL